MDILDGIRENGVVKGLVGGMMMENEVGLKIGSRIGLDGVGAGIGMEYEQRVDVNEVGEAGFKAKGDLVKERSEIANLLYLRCKSSPRFKQRR